MTQDIWNQVGWRENSVYPGTHWLFYDDRGNYRARVDLYPWENGLYTWRVMYWLTKKDDVIGLAYTLEAAQQAAEKIMNGIPVQLMLNIGRL